MRAQQLQQYDSATRIYLEIKLMTLCSKYQEFLKLAGQTGHFGSFDRWVREKIQGRNLFAKKLFFRGGVHSTNLKKIGKK